MSMKELISVDVTSFTVISTGIATLFALIFAILLAVAILLTVPNSFSVVVFITTTIVFGTMVSSVFLYFSEGYLYNVLSKRIRCISLDIDESGYIKKISPMGTALITGAIAFTMLVILYFAFALVLPLLLNSFISILMYAGQYIIAYMLYQYIFLLSSPMIVLIGIILITIITSLITVISVYIYNLLAGSERGIIVDLSKEDKYFVLDKIEYKNFAIAIATISLVLNLIIGVLQVISGSPLFSTLVSIFIGFFATFIEALILAACYNFLAPRIGKLRFELEN